MRKASPKFERPPVVETVVGAQFARLPAFTAAHAGWFWKTRLPENWGTVEEAPRLDDQFERFGEGEGWVMPALKLSPLEVARTQIVRDDDERMIQIQDSRLILNWRKRSGGYPTYEVLIEEFKKLLGDFERFAMDAGVGKIEYNQWEVTYINHVPRGEFWQSPADWVNLLPQIQIPAMADEVRGETISASWRCLIGDQQGRLYTTVRHGKVETGEVLSIDLTARGPADNRDGLLRGLDIGHDAIVWSFVAFTDEDAQRKFWKRSL